MAHRSAFTLIELLVTVTIVLVLAAVLSLAVTSVQRSAQEVVCLQNISRLMIATQTWITDNGGVMPQGHVPLSQIDSDDYWYYRQFIPNYIPEELRCPINPKWPAVTGFRYAINDNLRTYFPHLKLPVPSNRVVLVTEMYYFGDGVWTAGQLNYTQNGDYTHYNLQSHSGGMNFGFLDGHAERIMAPLGPDNQPNWDYPPVYAHDLKSGYYYDEQQFLCMFLGQIQF